MELRISGGWGLGGGPQFSERRVQADGNFVEFPEMEIAYATRLLAGRRAFWAGAVTGLEFKYSGVSIGGGAGKSSRIILAVDPYRVTKRPTACQSFESAASGTALEIAARPPSP